MSSGNVANMIRLGIAAVIGIPLVVGGISIAGYMWMFGDGELNVVAPYESAMVVKVDGAVVATLQAGDDAQLDVAQGEHEITLELTEIGTTATRTIDVSSGFYDAFTAAPDTCYVQMEVADAYYAPETGFSLPSLPSIEKRIKADDTIDMPSKTYFNEDDLPMEITEGETVRLITQLPCEMIDLSDTAIVKDYYGYGLASNDWFNF